MSTAARLRLRSALEDFIKSEEGDGGRGRTRSAQTSGDLVEKCRGVLGDIGGGNTTPDADSPGRRSAAVRARSGKSVAAGFDQAADRARHMMTGATSEQGE